MTIVHLALSSTYNEEFSYQENLLPKAQSEKGNKVFVIARNQRMENKRPVICEECNKKMEDGVTLIRVKTKIKRINSFSHPSKSVVLNVLSSLQPDIIWVHSLINKSLSIATSYKNNHKNVIIIADNHLDEHNIKLGLSRRLFLRLCSIRNKHLSNKINIFYGVTPGRRDFMIKYLGVPKEKSGVCIMGIDNNSLQVAKSGIAGYRKAICIDETKFVVLTGGKIDSDKKTIELMKSIKLMKNKNVVLIIFGSIDKQIEKEFNGLIDNELIKFVGWKSQEEINKLLLVSDLGVFLNSHSVLWENACACSLPCVFGLKEGFEHLFQFNNAIYHNFTTCEEFASFLNNLISSNEFSVLVKNSKKYSNEFVYDKIVEKIEADIARKECGR